VAFLFWRKNGDKRKDHGSHPEVHEGTGTLPELGELTERERVSRREVQKLFGNYEWR
jgi:hypothetical protein